MRNLVGLIATLVQSFDTLDSNGDGGGGPVVLQQELPFRYAYGGTAYHRSTPHNQTRWPHSFVARRVKRRSFGMPSAGKISWC